MATDRIVAELDNDVKQLIVQHSKLHGSNDKWIVNTALRVFLTLRINGLPEFATSESIEKLIKKVSR